jgi:hypothetical protein
MGLRRGRWTSLRLRQRLHLIEGRGWRILLFGRSGGSPAPTAPRLIAYRTIRHFSQPKLGERLEGAALRAGQRDQNFLAISVVHRGLASLARQPWLTLGLLRWNHHRRHFVQHSLSPIECCGHPSTLRSGSDIQPPVWCMSSRAPALHFGPSSTICSRPREGRMRGFLDFCQ